MLCAHESAGDEPRVVISTRPARTLGDRGWLMPEQMARWPLAPQAFPVDMIEKAPGELPVFQTGPQHTESKCAALGT